MKKIALAASLLLAVSPAYAGMSPGPEIGDGATGLVVLAVLIGGYFAVRYFRTRAH